MKELGCTSRDTIYPVLTSTTESPLAHGSGFHGQELLIITEWGIDISFEARPEPTYVGWRPLGPIPPFYRSVEVLDQSTLFEGDSRKS